jgi:FtsH-binding integral membrane protein
MAEHCPLSTVFPSIKDVPAGNPLVYVLYAGLSGLTLSSIFLVFTGSSIAEAFGVTAGTVNKESVRLITDIIGSDPRAFVR